MNGRTISLQSKRYKLINNSNTTPISNHGIGDHKTTHKDKETLVYSSNFIGHTLITTSDLRNVNKIAERGVGLLENQNGRNAIADIKPVMRGPS